MLLVFPARMTDAKILFEWRNDPLTREMSRSSDPVDWESHIAWLEARLALPRPRLHIVEKFGQPIGTFRIDGDEISYTIAPEHRGKGLAVSMLVEARRMFGSLRAEIYQRNVASIKVAERSGHLVHILEETS